MGSLGRVAETRLKKKKERKRDSNRRKEVEEYTDKGIERKRAREFQTALRRKGGACRVQLATDLIYDTPTWCVHPRRERRDDDVRILASKIARDPVVR